MRIGKSVFVIVFVGNRTAKNKTGATAVTDPLVPEEMTNDETRKVEI